MKSRTIKEALEEVIDELIDTGIFWPEVAREFEKLFIQKALYRTDGTVQEAAELMGIHRNTLSKKLREYEIERREIRREARKDKKKPR